MVSGRLVEVGSHAELMARKGVYYGLVMQQQLQGGAADSGAAAGGAMASLWGRMKAAPAAA